MSTPTNIPETPMGGAEQDSYPKSKEKFQQQLQDIFQTTLKLTGPGPFDQLCQWMEYNQYLTIDDFYHSSYNDPGKFDTEGPAAEYKWKGKMNHLSPIVAQKLKCFVKWMAHEDRPYELHDDFLATLTRDNYLKFRHMDSQSFKSFSASSPSHHEPYKHQVKKGPQRKAFFSQQEEISDDDEYANAEEQFSTDPESEEHSPYSVYQSSTHPKMPQKSFLPPNTWETLPESTKQMNIEHNKKVKLNNPTPYPSGSKTKPNPTLGKPTPAQQQVHQHSQDEPTEKATPDTSNQTLVNKCLAESGIDPTDIQNVMPVSYAKRNIPSHESSRQIQTHQVFARVNQSKHHNCDDLDPTDAPSTVPIVLQAPSDDTYNLKCTHSLMETQCNHSQYPNLMKKTYTHNLSTSQVSKSSHPNPVTFPYPPDLGEHVLETSSAPTTLVERDKLDLSSLILPKGEMESSFSWTCPFKSPTSSTLCFGERTLGKLNQEIDFYMTKHMPKPSSGSNRVSVSHSSLVTKNGEHFYGENFIHDFPKSWKHIKEVDWGDKLKLNYTTYGYMLMEIDWGGKFNYTSCGHPVANWQGHETHPTGHKTSEVDWGGHDPNGSDNPPPMSIINLDDLLGRTFLLPMAENGERKRATISEHVRDQLRFKLKIDGDQLDDLISYNQLMEYLEDKTDTGPLEDGFYRFKCIKDHKGPYISSDPEYNGGSYNLLIEWEPGEQTWEPQSNIIASDPCTCAVYAKEHDKFFDILHHMGFKTSEVDWGGHDPNPNHVNESLLSEVDWGAHNPDADDPEQLTGESIQSFLTFIVQLQWLIALGRLYLHKSLPCPSLW